jgi:signal transduction histidine kinase/DNA-binding response OmpR family regulator
LALKEHRPFYGEILNYRKDGSSFWIELNILPILNDKGHLNHFMSISRDMTEQKLAEATLQQGKSEAEKANKIKSQFLAMMSHEIRTPLNAMLGIQELLINTSLNALQREYMLIAKNSGGHLQRLVNDILDLTKVEAGKLDLEYISFNVVELTQLCVQLLTIQAQAKGLKLITIIDPKLTPWISGDPLRFRQVLLNLLSNAIKFTEQGSVTVKLSSYASTDSSCVLLVEVVDTGIGIPEDLQAGLFEVFVQVDPSDTRKYGGSGLGLAISKRLVTLWDGQIGIDSTPYVGSRFWFTVGASVVAPEQPLLPTIKQDESNRPNTFIVRVLLVEDNLINQAVMAAMLRSAGHHVDLADCGAKGIEAASEKDYDIILMDVSMPDMSGMEATAIIRQLGGAAAKVPIIAITAHALAGYEAMCLAAGMNGYATKPISQKNLQTIVATWCFKSKTQVLEALSTLTEDEDSRALKTDEPAILIDEAILADLNRFLGQEKFNEILQIFLISVNRSCEAIKQAIDSQDLSVFIREAHDLKSTSATFGATSLQVIAKDLEVYSDTDDISGALLAAELLLSCAKRTIEALECFN